MAKKKSAASRRRSKPRLGRKTFVYFTDEERKQVDEAAKFERRSIRSADFLSTPTSRLLPRSTRSNSGGPKWKPFGDARW